MEIGTVVVIIKEIASFAKKAKNFDLMSKVTDLQQMVMELDQENRALKEKLAFKEKMTFKRPFWYAEGDETPYCPTCWEGQKTAVHLLGPDGERFSRCPVCGKGFDEKGLGSSRAPGIEVMGRDSHLPSVFDQLEGL